MKTLEEIKNEVSKVYLYHDFQTSLDLFQKGAISQVTFDGFLNQIIVDTCKEALKNASDNAKCTFDRETINDSDGDSQIIVQSIDKQSILNESNIPKL